MSYFLNSMIWSICGCVSEEGKKKIDVYIRKLEDVFPIKDTVYHYYVDTNYCKFQHWEQKLSINTPWKYDREYNYNIEHVKCIKNILLINFLFSG